MGVDGEAGEVHRDAAHHVGRLAPDSGEGRQVRHPGRHLTAEALDDAGRHPDRLLVLFG